MGAPFEAGPASVRVTQGEASKAEASAAKAPRLSKSAMVIAMPSVNERRLEAELADLRQQVEHLISERARDRSRAANDIRRLRVAHAQAEQRLINVRRMISYRLGDALMAGFRDWTGFRALPGRLTELWREARRRRIHRPVVEPAVLPSMSVLDAVENGMKDFRRAGLPAVLEFLKIHPVQTDSVRAAIASELAKEVFEIDVMAGLELGRAAIALDPKPVRIKWFAFKLFEAGQVSEAKTWLDRVRQETPVFRKTSEALFANEIDSHHELLGAPLVLPERAAAAFVSEPRRIAYVVSSAMPFHNTGYTNRTQAVAGMLRRQGYDVAVFARPGYPFDRTDVSLPADRQAYDIEGVPYSIALDRISHNLPVSAKFEQAAQVLERIFREFRPAVVQAASDHRNALPALIAARRLGLPFIYEVRGMWEFTKASKRIDWEGTERFQVVTRLETLCAQGADGVLTLTGAMRDELVQRDVARAKIAIAPNCVDSQRFKPRPRDEELRAALGFAPDDFVVGYAGSLVEYEGLDDLLYAVDALRERRPQLRVLITGEGSHKAALDAILHQHRLGDIVRLAGRVPPSEVVRHVACFDAYAVPRRPERVCQLVSPLKPLEGMAMRKPVIVSDVGGMADLVTDGVTGFVFHAGDFRALGDAILAAMDNPLATAAIAEAGRRHVEVERNWQHGVAEMISAYERLTKA